jgi:FkbM family methyltransferase
MSNVEALARKFTRFLPAEFLALNLRGLHIAARLRGFRVRLGGDVVDVMNGNRTVRLRRAHWFYAFDIMDSFEYYFSALVPFARAGTAIVDYSFPRFHEVVGYDRHPVFFPSLAEPIVTTTQCADFADLKPGMTVIDLGAYSGLTSMVFQDAVGPSGNVVAVEADENNVIAIRKNFELYRSLTGVVIQLLEGAVWKDDLGLEFSCEENIGSSAVAMVGAGRGRVRTVPSFTLSSIAERAGLGACRTITRDQEGRVGAQHVIVGVQTSAGGLFSTGS